MYKIYIKKYMSYLSFFTCVFITFIFMSFVTSHPMCWRMYLVMIEIYIYIRMNRIKNKKLNNHETAPKTY